MLFFCISAGLLFYEQFNLMLNCFSCGKINKDMTFRKQIKKFVIDMAFLRVVQRNLLYQNYEIKTFNLHVSLVEKTQLCLMFILRGFIRQLQERAKKLLLFHQKDCHTQLTTTINTRASH